MPHRLGRDHPIPQLLGELTIDIDTLDRKVHCDAIIELKLPLEIYLDQRPEMRLFCFVKLAPLITASVLTVQQHVERPA